MDYEKIVHHLGSLGHFQKLLIIKIFLPIFLAAYSIVIPNFCLGVHLHRCKIPWLPNDTYEIQDEYHASVVNNSIPISPDGQYEECTIIVNGSEQRCAAWVYDQSVFTETVISQFDLVCDKKLSKSHAVLMTFLGFLASPFIVNPQADIFGRRRMYCLCITILAIVNLIIPFSTNIYVFGALRFLDGFLYLPLYAFAFIIVIELVGAERRNLVSVLLLLSFTVGELRLALFAYFIRNWKWLYLTCAVTNIPFLIYWWPKVFPESPRWLISRGRIREALVIIRRISKTNKVVLPKELEAVKVSDEPGLTFPQILKQLGKSRRLLFYLAIAMSNWYMDDVMSFNNPKFVDYLSRIYLSELENKETTESYNTASYLGIMLCYDTDKPPSQRYVCDRLTSSLRKFYGRYGELVIHYDEKGMISGMTTLRYKPTRKFIASLAHYGIKMNVSNLGGDLFVAFIILVIAESLGYTLCWPMDYVGHKRLLVIALFATGICCLIPFVLILAVDDAPEWIILTFIMCGKLFISTVFGMIYTYTGELFPTDIRSFTIGSCSFFARIGSLASPYLYQIASGRMQKALPLIIYTAVLALVGSISLVLPETSKTTLPDQMNASVHKENVELSMPLKSEGENENQNMESTEKEENTFSDENNS